MTLKSRIEQTLDEALIRAEGRAPGAPGGANPRLIAALRHAVFPGGGRLRPRLCLAVHEACGRPAPKLAESAAAAIEFLHCASLVHDDLPCFDDAELRRGRPSVHAKFGAPLGVLAGDALIVLAFQILSRDGAGAPERLVPLIRVISSAVGMPHGIVGGQALESEPAIALDSYHQAKTGILFAAATEAGAIAAGEDGAAWTALGARLGEAYQVADDLRDLVASEAEIGKPCGQDAACQRPNAAAAMGLDGAVARLKDLVAAAQAAIPPCPGAEDLQALITAETKRFLPKALATQAA